MYGYICIHMYIHMYIYIYMINYQARALERTCVLPVNCSIIEVIMELIYTRLVSNSAPTWSSRCCFTARHF